MKNYNQKKKKKEKRKKKKKLGLEILLEMLLTGESNLLGFR